MTCRVCRQGFGLHLTTCPLTPTKPERPPREPTERRRYSRPSRPRTPRADYLATVAAGHGTARRWAQGCRSGCPASPTCSEVAVAKQRAYRARRRAGLGTPDVAG